MPGRRAAAACRPSVACITSVRCAAMPRSVSTASRISLGSIAWVEAALRITSRARASAPARAEAAASSALREGLDRPGAIPARPAAHVLGSASMGKFSREPLKVRSCCSCERSSLTRDCGVSGCRAGKRDWTRGEAVLLLASEERRAPPSKAPRRRALPGAVASRKLVRQHPALALYAGARPGRIGGKRVVAHRARWLTEKWLVGPGRRRDGLRHRLRGAVSLGGPDPPPLPQRYS
eukprot:scaffold9442_cov117-Isochrysis_galbana.AAC.5